MYYYADFETSTRLVNGKVNVYLWGILSENGNYKQVGVNLDSFMKEISNYNTSPTIYFHNLSWDGSFIVHWLVDNGYSFVDKVEGNYEDKIFTWISDYNTSIYTIKVRVDKYIIKFVDSYKILVNSVDKLGKALGKEKLDLDYDKYTHFNTIEEVPQELMDYLIRDIDIVRETMITFKSGVNKTKLTIASTMYNEFKNFYGENNFKKDFTQKLSREQWSIVKKSFAGGYVNVSPRYKGVDLVLKDNGYSYDVNSLYPYVMLHYKLPYGEVYDSKSSDNDICLLEVIIFKGKKVIEDLPPIIPRAENDFETRSRYVETIENGTYYIWENEFEIWKKFYDLDYGIVKRHWFRTKYVFKDFMELMSERKIMAKNPVEYLIAKIMQNSLFGKFGQAIDRRVKVLEKDTDNILKGKRYGDNEEWVERIIIDSKENNFPYIPIASYITSRARSILFTAMLENANNFLYCDTDSLYLKGQAKGLKIDNKEYGAWKQEYTFNRFKALKSKCYMVNDINKGLIVKVAGLPESGKKHLNFDNFSIGTSLGKIKLQKTHHKGGIILEQGEYTL